MLYRINLPHDFGSESATAALQAAFPELEGSELEVAAFDAIHAMWPGLRLVQETDYGGIFEATSEMPGNLPDWVWVTRIEE